MPTDVRGYEIPETPVPADVRCIKIYVPADWKYYEQFWQAYEHFTKWTAWARDPFKRGKLAAGAWKRAFDMARADWLSGRGCEMAITNIRQNPVLPCKLEFSEDGVTWTEFADISKCRSASGSLGEVLQFDGTNILVPDPCSGEYIPAGPPFNPTTSGSFLTPYVGDPNAACNGAANIAAWLEKMADVQLNLLAAGAAVGLIANGIQAFVDFMSSVYILEPLRAFLLEQFTFDNTILNDAAALDITNDVRDLLVLYIDVDGTISGPKFDSAINALIAVTAAQTPNTGERVKWGHVTNLLQILGPYQASNRNHWAGITDADCGSTGWRHEFNFAGANAQGWIAAETDYQTWGLIAPGGWLVEHNHNPSGFYTIALIGRAFQVRTVTKVEIYYDAMTVAGSGVDTPTLRLWELSQIVPTGATTGSPIASQTLIDGAGQLHTFVVSETSSGLVVELFVAGATGGVADPGGNGAITKVVIYGDGLDPF